MIDIYRKLAAIDVVKCHVALESRSKDIETLKKSADDMLDAIMANELDADDGFFIVFADDLEARLESESYAKFQIDKIRSIMRNLESKLNDP